MIPFRLPLFFLVFILFFFSPAFSQPSDTVFVTLPAVVVTSEPVPTGALQVNRLVQVIDESHVRELNPQSVGEVLQAFTSVDLQPRGPFDVQTDVSIRGTLFSQSLVLINGSRLNDPQTAHHNLDLPVPLNQIERIEVLKGPASALYGPDAFGGVINILTKIPSPGEARVGISGGEYGFRSASGSFALSAPGWRSLTSAEYRRSAGYRFDTDFETWSLSSSHDVNIFGNTYSLMLGGSAKRFGAYDFYSPGRHVPSKEWTSSGFADVNTRFLVSSVLVQPSLFFHRHDDTFMYDIRTPDRFVNVHGKNSYGGKVTGTLRLDERNVFSGGVESAVDEIRSTSLGDHTRSLMSLSVSANVGLAEEIGLEGGIRYDRSSAYGSQINPTLGIGVALGGRGKAFAYAGRSFRAPSYTELYYADPSNQGNASLHPEAGWSTEAGAQYEIADLLVGSASVHFSRQEDLIDYVQYVPGGKYYAINFTSATIRGVESALEWSAGLRQPGHDEIRLQRALVQYAFVESATDRPGIVNAKYLFTHSKHQVSGMVGGTLPFAVESSVSFVYKYRTRSRQYAVVNVGVSRSFAPFNLFVKVLNLFDRQYEEITGIPQPGRVAVAGIGMEWGE